MRRKGILSVVALFAVAWLTEALVSVGGGSGYLIAATTLTTDIDEMQKIIFDDTMISSVVTDSEILDIFDEGDGIKTNETTGGRYIELAQMFRLPAGVGARGEDGYIPVPSGPVVVNGQVTLKKILGTLEMSADVMKRVRTDIGAYADWAEKAAPSLVERVTHEIDRMMLGYGSAIKARVNDATPATNLIVDDSFGIAGAGAALLQFLEGETLIASPNANGSSPRAGVMTVTQVDFDNGYIVVDALATSLANNDYLFPGDAADNSAGKEPMGLFGMVDDGGILSTFQGIDRTTWRKYQSYVKDAATASLSELMLVEADDETYVRGAGKPNLLITARRGRRQLWTELKTDRQINDPRAYTGGIPGKGVVIWLFDRPTMVRVGRKLPEDVCFGIQRDTIRKWMLNRWEWDDTTGSLWRQVTDATGRKDAFYSYGRMYLECGCYNPQKNFRIDNIGTT